MNYIKNEKGQIKQLLQTDIYSLTLEGMSKFVHSLHEKIKISKEIEKLARFEKPLKVQLEESRIKLRELKYQSRVDELDFKKQQIKADIEHLKLEKERQRNEEEWMKARMEANLNIKRTNVFFRDELIPEEIGILHENGFEDSNEYDIIDKKVVPVLVKKILNHTPTHTFLVWSVKNYLSKFSDVEDLKHHDTKYPDITFKIGIHPYAIEVECGSLLRKKRLATAKVKFLNRNFGWRWMFLVSNKNLLPKYRKLGLTTQRSEVAKMLENWVKYPI